MDFSKARLNDFRWWQRLKWTVTELNRQQSLDYYQLRLIQLSGQLSRHRIDPNSFDALQKSASDIIAEARLALFGDPVQKLTGKDYKAMWAEHFGDPDSPEVKAKIADFVAAMKKLGEPDVVAAPVGPRKLKMTRGRRNIR